MINSKVLRDSLVSESLFFRHERPSVDLDFQQTAAFSDRPMR